MLPVVPGKLGHGELAGGQAAHELGRSPAPKGVGQGLALGITEGLIGRNPPLRTGPAKACPRTVHPSKFGFAEILEEHVHPRPDRRPPLVPRVRPHFPPVRLSCSIGRGQPPPLRRRSENAGWPGRRSGWPGGRTDHPGSPQACLRRFDPGLHQGRHSTDRVVRPARPPRKALGRGFRGEASSAAASR